MAVDTLLSHSVQQHARALHGQLSQLLASTLDDASSPAIVATAQELRQVTACNNQLARALAATASNIQGPAPAAEDAEELQTACNQRQELLQDLLQTLDDSVQGLRTQLDACHKLVRVPPCQQDPEDIIRYAFTLRHGFAPLGSAPGLPMVAPAPQLPFIMHSTLRMYNMDVANQKQQVQQGPQAPDLAAMQAQQQQQPAAPAAGPMGQAALAVPQLPSVPFMLNADLYDSDDMLGSETSEEYSEDSDTE